MFQKESPVTPLLQNRSAVTGHDNDAGAIDETLQALLRLLDETRVTRSYQLVEQENV